MRHALARQLVKARGGAGLDLYRAEDADTLGVDDDDDTTYFLFAQLLGTNNQRCPVNNSLHQG